MVMDDGSSVSFCIVVQSVFLRVLEKCNIVDRSFAVKIEKFVILRLFYFLFSRNKSATL